MSPKTSSRPNCKRSSWRRLEDVLETRLEGVLQKSWKRLEDVFGRRVAKISGEDVLRRRFKDVFDVLRRRLEDVFGRLLANTSWRCLEDILKRLLEKTWKTKNCYSKDLFKTSWRHLGKQEMFGRFVECIIFSVKKYFFKESFIFFQKVLFFKKVLFLLNIITNILTRHWEITKNQKMTLQTMFYHPT